MLVMEWQLNGCHDHKACSPLLADFGRGCGGVDAYRDDLVVRMIRCLRLGSEGGGNKKG